MRKPSLHHLCGSWILHDSFWSAALEWKYVSDHVTAVFTPAGDTPFDLEREGYTKRRCHYTLMSTSTFSNLPTASNPPPPRAKLVDPETPTFSPVLHEPELPSGLSTHAFSYRDAARLHWLRKGLLHNLKVRSRFSALHLGRIRSQNDTSLLLNR